MFNRILNRIDEHFIPLVSILGWITMIFSAILGLWNLYFIVFTMLFRQFSVDFDVKPQKYHSGADR